MLRVVCWKWKPADVYRSTFTAQHVNVLKSMVARNLRIEHEMVCITDDPAGIDPAVRCIKLWNDHARVPSPHGRGQPSCYRRLKAFSAEAAELIGPRFVSLDLDVVITGDVTPLWDREEDFVIWGDTNPTTPYNGSMWLLRAGTRRQVWEQFDPRMSPKLALRCGYFGSDQAWIGACLGPREAKWTRADGVLSYRNDVRPTALANRGKDMQLPKGTRIVVFHGRYDPWTPEVMRRHSWVREHWR